MTETIHSAYGEQATDWQRKAEASYVVGFPVEKMNRDELLAAIGALQSALNANFRAEAAMHLADQREMRVIAERFLC